MPIRFTMTNEDQGQDYDGPRQGYPMQRSREHGIRPATTTERWVRRHSFEEVSTNDPGVKLKTPAGTNNNLLNTVTGTVAGLVVYNIASGILTGVLALAAAALAAFVGFKMFHGGLQGKGGDDHGAR